MTSNPPTSLEPHPVSLLTTVLWTLALAMGVAGLCLPYPAPATATAASPPVQAQIIQASIPPAEPEPPPRPAPQPPQTPERQPSPAPPAPTPAPLPAAPAMVPVAAPDPSLSFAVPVAGLTQLVPPEEAFHGAPAAGPSNTVPAAPAAQPPAPPPVARLTLGQGEGNQPPPSYPREAVLQHQEGTVTLQFNVDARGNVTDVQITDPSPWPLLNQAAREAVRHTWHFSPGRPRAYQVPIQFQLAH
ncbi:MAG TPA: energy transducer TonB [Phycisphaerae bacterium]|nr:energy transducer TonB [Phycisphaerae bacterium]